MSSRRSSGDGRMGEDASTCPGLRGRRVRLFRGRRLFLALSRRRVLSRAQRMDGVPVSRGAAEGLPDGIRRPGKLPGLPELGLDRLGEPAVPGSLPKDAGPGRPPGSGRWRSQASRPCGVMGYGRIAFSLTSSWSRRRRLTYSRSVVANRPETPELVMAQ